MSNLISLSSIRKRVPLKFLGAILSAVIFIAAILAIHHILQHTHISDIRSFVENISWKYIALSVLFAAGSYLTLTGYDYLAIRHIGKTIPYKFAALGAFISYSISHNIGLSLVTGGSLRFRIYSRVGLSPSDVILLTLICGMTFSLGVILMVGMAFLLEPQEVSLISRLPYSINITVGVIVILLLVGYLVWIFLGKRSIKIKETEFELPNFKSTLAQLLLGVIDLSFAAAALYVLMPQEMTMGFLPFAGIFVVAISLGFLSHVPGSIGVFEALMLLALPTVAPEKLLASLLMFRVTYYLLPFCLASLSLAVIESINLHRFNKDRVIQLQGVANAVAPTLIGTTVFIAGAWMLISGATPILPQRLSGMEHLVPLHIVEISHLFGSVIGVMLLILARALYHRLDGAHRITLLLVGAGIILSIVEGFYYGEAILLTAVFVLLLGSRNAFYRKSALLEEPLNIRWIVTILIVLLLSIGIGFFAYKNVEYSHSLWWEFAYSSDASRFLRATLISTILVLIYFTLKLLRPASSATVEFERPSQTVEEIVLSSSRADAHLAFTGDKQFILSDLKDACIMYGISGRSWITLGDPFGNEESAKDLLWKFREEVDLHDGRPVFYQVGIENIPYYLDMGLAVQKIGEFGSVDLRTFSLDGPSNKKLRYAIRRGEKDGLSFEVCRSEHITQNIDILKSISDSWLEDKSTHEKKFSVGSFDPEYLRRSDCALILDNGKIVAFANLLKSHNFEELSIDLMRYGSDAPRNTMDYLFSKLLLWGQQEGFLTFSLGMVPLAGLENRSLASTWSKFGTLIFKHGEHFYNFEGLKAYKDKFSPVWTPRYLAHPSGLSLPRVLLDIASLIAGSPTKIFSK